MFWHQRIYDTTLGFRDISTWRFLWRGGIGYSSSWISTLVSAAPFARSRLFKLRLSKMFGVFKSNVWKPIFPANSAAFQLNNHFTLCLLSNISSLLLSLLLILEKKRFCDLMTFAALGNLKPKGKITLIGKMFFWNLLFFLCYFVIFWVWNCSWYLLTL